MEGVLCLETAAWIGQSQGTAERIGQEIPRARRIRPLKIFVHAASEQIRRGSRAGDFLDRICPVVEILRHPANRLADAAAERVMLKTRGRSAADGYQLIPRVPGVGIRSVAGQVAVGVVREARAFPLRAL